MQPQYVLLTYSQSINPATALPVDCWLGVVPAGEEWELVEVIETHSIAGTDGSAVTADLVKASATTTPANGTSLLASTFNLKSTLNTPVSKVRGNGVAVAEATRTVRAGQQIGINFTGTLTALAGMALIAKFAIRRKGVYR